MEKSLSSSKYANMFYFFTYTLVCARLYINYRLFTCLHVNHLIFWFTGFSYRFVDSAKAVLLNHLFYVIRFKLLLFISGPFYKFRTFKDMINRPFSNRIPIWDSISLRVPQAPVYGMIYLLVSYFYTIHVSERYHDSALSNALFQFIKGLHVCHC